MHGPGCWGHSVPTRDVLLYSAFGAGLRGSASARAEASPSLPVAVSCRRRADFDNVLGLPDAMTTSPARSRFVLPACPRAGAAQAGDTLPMGAVGKQRVCAGSGGAKGASPLAFDSAAMTALASEHCGTDSEASSASRGCLSDWGAAVASGQALPGGVNVRAGHSPPEGLHAARPASATSPDSGPASPPLSPAESPGGSRSKGKSRVLCADCGRSFGRQADLNRHVRHVHQRRRNFRCPFCSHEFAERGHFTSHVAAVHRRQHEADSSSSSKQALSRLAEACRIAGSGDWVCSVDSIARALAPICRSRCSQSLTDMLVRTTRHSFAGPAPRASGAREGPAQLQSGAKGAQWPTSPSNHGRPRGGSSGSDMAANSPPDSARVPPQAHAQDHLVNRLELPSTTRHVRPGTGHPRLAITPSAGHDPRFNPPGQAPHIAASHWQTVGYGGPEPHAFHPAAQWHPAMGPSPFHQMMPFHGQASIVVMTPSGPMLVPRSVVEQAPPQGYGPQGPGGSLCAPVVPSHLALAQAHRPDYMLHHASHHMVARGASAPGTLQESDAHGNMQSFGRTVPVSCEPCPPAAPRAASPPQRQEPLHAAHSRPAETSMGALAAAAASEHLTASTPPVTPSAAAGAMPDVATALASQPGQVVVPRIR